MSAGPERAAPCACPVEVMVESIQVEGGGGGDMALTVTLDAAALVDGASPAPPAAVGSVVVAQCAATAGRAADCLLIVYPRVPPLTVCP